MDSVEQVPRELVAGKYQLTRLLGRGGMGSVWEGIHTSLGTRVAVKFIETEYVGSPEARSRFDNEARAAAKLRSKHVVKVYDHGVLSDGRPYIVMEFLDGEPLDQRLDRFGRLPAQHAAHILAQVCRALANAHSVGIVHRDLKPENVFLVWDEEDQADIIKVVDFGIAKFTDGAMGVSSSTRTGSVLGTPYYMSPEQARGLRTLDHRSDLWSLGVIAYRCIVGQLPFGGEAVGDLLVNICTAPLPVPSQLATDIPPGFDQWFFKALSRDPAARFASAAELGETLAAVCGLARAQSGGANSQAAQMPQPSDPWKEHARARDAAATPAAGAQTAAPVAQTPMEPVRSTSRWGIVAASVFGIGVVAIGVVATAMMLGSEGAVSEPDAALGASAQPVATPSASQVQPVAPPSVEPAAPIPETPDAGVAKADSVTPVQPKRSTTRRTSSGRTATQKAGSASSPKTKPRSDSVDIGY